MKAVKLSKKLMAVVLTMILAVSCFVIPTALVHAEGSEVTVNFHYLRNDNNYDDMSVWAWATEPISRDGASYDFVNNGDADGAVATVKVTDGSTKFGFIVRKNDWSLKDTEADRFLDLGAIISGTVDVYCKTGEEEFTVKEGDDVVKGVKLAKATVTDKTTVNYSLTNSAEKQLTADDFVIADAAGNLIEIVDVIEVGDASSGVIRLATELDYSKEYTITFSGVTMPLTMPEYFSSKEFEDAYTYEGDDLGAAYTAEKTTFRVWAPTAQKLEVNLYDAGNGGKATQVVEMTADVKGTWVATINGDLNKKYYTYNAYFEGNKVNKDICDPYAKTVGVNGKRAEILDMDFTNPVGWDADKNPVKGSFTDQEIYELHIRDFSISPNSGITNKGKYIAFTEEGTKDTETGVATGMDHIKDLGVTAVHILPSYDFGSVDETKLDQAQFNWGYDPVNYNAPEGSYSTDPYNGEVRVNEYKQMVQALHKNNINVIMDVVYNHTYNTDYCFNQLVPGYFYRPDSNGSGCGNDVASERSMVRKFIVDSVKYWASEYKLDGFRFDLMGLIDVDTMNAVRAAVDEVDPTIFIYGEGWTMSTKTTKSVKMATQTNSALTPGIAYFSDNFRDTAKGSVFEAEGQGYVNGKGDFHGKAMFSLTKAVSSWTTNPQQTVNYVDCHDNLAIWDKINSSTPDYTDAQRIEVNKLAAALVQTSQGVPFLLSGEEFLRTKTKEDGTFDHNSYASSDAVNMLDYARVAQYQDVYNYYKGLIAMRKAHPGFRMPTSDEIESNITYLDEASADKGVIAYTINGGANGETAEKIMVVYNPLTTDSTVTLPDGDWDVYVNNTTAGDAVLSTENGTVTVPAISAMVLMQGYVAPTPDEPSQPDEPSDEPSNEPSDEPSAEPSNDDNSKDEPSQQNSTASEVSNSDNSNADTSKDNKADTSDNNGTVPTGSQPIAVVFVVVALAAAGVIFVTSRKSKRV